MKKLILIAFMFGLSMTGFAQQSWFKAVSYAITPMPEVHWSQWYSTDIDISVDPITGRILIFSKKTQSIKCEEFVYKETEAYNMFYATGLDSDFKTVLVVLLVRSDGQTELAISYSDCAYKYLLVLNNP